MLASTRVITRAQIHISAGMVRVVSPLSVAGRDLGSDLIRELDQDRLVSRALVHRHVYMATSRGNRIIYTTRILAILVNDAVDARNN